MQRRTFLCLAGGTAFGRAKLSHKERVDRALKGADVDRPAFSFWHHFGLKTAGEHASKTLEFHRAYRTDLVKVMSDFPYPRPSGRWYELRPEMNPFAPQIEALKQIRDGLDGRAYFVETVFNSWNVAEKLSSKEEIRRLKQENPEALLHALDVITTSQIHHAKRAFSTGASGILLAVANANRNELSKADYVKFSAPFDRRLLEAVSAARINILHLHVDPDYLDAVAGFPAQVVNYSLHVTGISFTDARKHFSQTLMGGIDERNYRTLTAEEIREQWKAAASSAGARFLLSPGCSVPNESTREELELLPKVLGA
jgi:uroporphyrinogen decarboxylase